MKNILRLPMKRPFAAFVVVVSIGPVCPGCKDAVTPPKKAPLPQPAPPAVVDIESIDGGFKVAFPSQPVLKAEKSKTGKPIENYVLQTGANALMIGFSYPSFPLPLVNDAMIDAGLDGAVANYVHASKGQILSKEVFVMGEVRGVKFESKIICAQPGDTADVKGRVFWVDGRLVRMLAIGQPNWLQSKEVDEFFKSFSVVQPKQATKS
jgi:hypothetical protein